MGFDDVKQSLLYDWFNCNPVYVLKCKYYSNMEKPSVAERFVAERAFGCYGHSRSPGTAVVSNRQNPMACGEDPLQVRFFMVGKEYLFVKAERRVQAIREAESRGSFLEIEGMVEQLFALCHRLTLLFRILGSEYVAGE